jgi:16S rRNA (uracil1498-N3)-methyltransferase
MTAPTITVHRLPAAGEPLRLDGQPYHYLVRVRRIAVDDLVRITDADGASGTARVVALTDTELHLRVETALPAGDAPDIRFTLVSSGLKSGGTADLVAACAELGVDRLTLVNMVRSVARVDEGKLDRLERVASEAARKVAQTRRTTLEVAASLADLLDDAAGSLVCAMDEDDGIPLDAVPLEEAAEVVVVVGPEGGFEGHERELLRHAGATFVRLQGPAYRARTAAFMTAVLFLYRMGRL